MPPRNLALDRIHKGCDSNKQEQRAWQNSGKSRSPRPLIPAGGGHEAPFLRRDLALTRRSALITPAAFVATTGVAHAAGWEQIDNDNGVRVFRKEVTGSGLVAFKGLTVIPAPVGKLLWVLADNDHRTEWVDRLEKSVVLERRGPYDYVVYQAFDLPFPISDRDYVYRGHAVRDKSGNVILHLQSTTHKKAPPTIGVRAQLISSKYTLVPSFGGDKNKTEVTVEIHTDPKGLIPNWLVNLIQKSWPMKTLVAMRDQVKKPYVKTLALPDD